MHCTIRLIFYEYLHGIVYKAEQVHLPEPVVTWLHEPELNVVEVSKYPGTMTNLEIVDLHIVSESAFPSSGSPSLGQ